MTTAYEPLIESTVEIDAPPSVVWPLVSDLVGMSQRSPQVVKTHVRGGGTFESGVEKCRVQVTLASQIPEKVCRQINLGYRDPGSIEIEAYANREAEGVLLVRKAGEQLYRLEESA